MIAGAATVALAAVAAFAPPAASRGFGALSFYSPGVRLVAVGCMVAAVFPRTGSLVWKALLRSARALSRTGAGGIAVTGGGVAVVAFAFRSRTLLTGDATYLLNNYRLAIENGVSVPRFLRVAIASNPVSVGTDLLHFVSARAAVGFGSSAHNGVVFEVCLWAAVAAMAGVWILARQGPSPETVWATSMVSTSAVAVLGFGYVENYAPVVVLSGIGIATAARGLHRRTPPVLPTAIFTLALGFHVEALLFAPFLLWLWIRWVRPARAGSAAAVVIVATGIGTAVVAAFPRVLSPVLVRMGVDGGVLGPPAARQLADIAIGMANLVPSFPLVACIAAATLGPILRRRDAAAAGPDREAGSSARATALGFAATIAAPAGLALLLVRPSLGMARDWDLLAVTTYGLLALPVAGIFLRGGRVPDHALGSAVALSAILTAASVGVFASETRAVDRYVSTLEFDDSRAGYAWENVADHYARLADVDRSVGALRSAWRAEPNPRYLHKIGRIYSRASRYGDAIEPLERALRSWPDDAGIRSLLARCLLETGDTAGAANIAAEGVRLDPSSASLHFLRGRALLAGGDVAAGTRELITCLGLDPTPSTRAAIEQLLSRAPEPAPARSPGVPGE